MLPWLALTPLPRARCCAAGETSAPVPEVTLDGDANGAVAVWHNGRRATGAIQARRIAPNGGLGPILNLSPRGNRLESPEVAVGAGTATAVWTGSHRVQARHFRYR